MGVTLPAGCATGLGALPTLVSHRIYDGSLGLAARVVVGAGVFALVPEPELGSPYEVGAGVLANAMIAVVFRKLIPSSHGHGDADIATATFVCGSRSRSSSIPC
ncbi:hypothetical protein [Halomontanus rarus]|uniref:hypothetical protein n=1 Tax=Halomontanus rarus TaxID=3034020 RepID=UPI001A983C9A